MKLHHLALPSGNLQRSAHFYGQVLGLEALEAPRPEALWYRAGEIVLMVELADAFEPHAMCVAFATRGIEKERVRQRLTTHGVAIERESAYTIYVRDPDGHRIGFSDYSFEDP